MTIRIEIDDNGMVTTPWGRFLVTGIVKGESTVGVTLEEQMDAAAQQDRLKWVREYEAAEQMGDRVRAIEIEASTMLDSVVLSNGHSFCPCCGHRPCAKLWLDLMRPGWRGPDH